MTDTPTQDPSPAKSSSTRTIVIAIIAVVVLAGGAFAAYKLTRSEDSGAGPFKVAHDVRQAIEDGNTATITKLSTSKGKIALLTLKPADVEGLQWGGCQPTAFAAAASKSCTWTRPGGQVVFVLTAPDKKWVVDEVTVGPVATTPTSAATPPSS